MVQNATRLCAMLPAISASWADLAVLKQAGGRDAEHESVDFAILLQKLVRDMAANHKPSTSQVPSTAAFYWNECVN